MGVCNCSMFCCTFLYVHFSIAIILMGKRELIALLNLSSWCLVMVERLFLTVPRGCLQFVIVVFPDHTHLLFLNLKLVRHFSQKVLQLHELTYNLSCTQNSKEEVQYIRALTLNSKIFANYNRCIFGREICLFFVDSQCFYKILGHLAPEDPVVE